MYLPIFDRGEVLVNSVIDFNTSNTFGDAATRKYISKPTVFLWRLVQDKKDWQRQDAQARCLYGGPHWTKLFAYQIWVLLGKC